LQEAQTHVRARPRAGAEGFPSPPPDLRQRQRGDAGGKRQIFRPADAVR